MLLDQLLSSWFWSGSTRCGFCTGTALSLVLVLLLWVCGIHSSLSLGPGGEFPGVYDFVFYAFSHEEFTSLVHSVTLLLCLGPSQERRWGTLAFLCLALLSTVLLPPIYALFLFVTGDEASRVSGYAATQLALFTAQCRQARQRRVLRYLPLWSLPWILLLIDLFLLPGAPGLLHFYAICLGLNYSSEFIEILQRIEGLGVCSCLPTWAYISVTPHSHDNTFQLPTYISPAHRSELYVEPSHMGPVASTSRSQLEDHSLLQPWKHSGVSDWPPQPALASDAQLLEEQLLRAGILASLQDAPEGTADKVEVPKSSVSSLSKLNLIISTFIKETCSRERVLCMAGVLNSAQHWLQQLEKMGFPMEKAVVALAATGQLDGAISLLIEDQIGENAVVVSKGKKTPTT